MIAEVHLIRRTITAIVLCCTAVSAVATHIVGGEMFYDFLGYDGQGMNRYRITLKIFRDCGPGTADFDGVWGGTPALITVLESAGEAVGVYDIGAPAISGVPNMITSPCMNVPGNICVEQGVYTYTISLAPLKGGYWIVYQRCCRNNSILNLTNPGRQGSTYYTFIPGPEVAATNSSPRFTNHPPVFLCDNFDLSYAQAATDPDGDQLVYKFSSPLQGLDVCCPALGGNVGGSDCFNPPMACPQVAGPPPYPAVFYTNPYSPGYPVASNPAFAINKQNGAMSGAPNLTGQFVVNVAVEEYRNGILINTHFRDFQFNIVPCMGVISQFKKQDKCQGLDFTFTNTSFNGGNFKWDFGVPGMESDTSRIMNPHFIFPDTGIFMVTLIVNPGDTCTDTSRQQVRVYPPLDIGFDQPAPACLSRNSFSFVTRGTYGPFTKFRWQFGENAKPPFSVERDPAGVRYTAAGNHIVWLKAAHFLCVDSLMDSIRIFPMPALEISDPGLLCEPATATLVNKIMPDQPLDLEWQSGAMSHGGPVAVFEYRRADTYTAQLIGTLHEMCRDTARIKFTVHKKPRAQFEVSSKTATILEPEIGIKSLVDDAVKHFYVFSDGTYEQYISGLKKFDAEGDYIITQYVTSFMGCTDSTSMLVRILPEHLLWMPDAFTPDNDELNDTFGPTLMGVEKYRFEIFDRWGRRIFITDDPAIGWDGSSNGKPSPQGVYVYKLSYKSRVDGTPYSRNGHVTLLRSE